MEGEIMTTRILGWHDEEETFDFAVQINRCIEFEYKGKVYAIDHATQINPEWKRAIWQGVGNVISHFKDADDFLQNAHIDSISIREVIAASYIISY
jgi:hypothetical protein